MRVTLPIMPAIMREDAAKQSMREPGAAEQSSCLAPWSMIVSQARVSFILQTRLDSLPKAHASRSSFRPKSHAHSLWSLNSATVASMCRLSACFAVLYESLSLHSLCTSFLGAFQSPQRLITAPTLFATDSTWPATVAKRIFLSGCEQLSGFATVCTLGIYETMSI